MEHKHSKECCIESPDSYTGFLSGKLPGKLLHSKTGSAQVLRSLELGCSYGRVKGTRKGFRF